MKTLISFLILCSGIVQAVDDGGNYLNFIIQFQNDANQTTHKIDDVPPNGDATALAGVTTSAVFQLWTIHRTEGTEYLLDEKTVSSYHPKATITITSEDPYTAIPRTRIDKPFSVTTNVTGLITNDSEAPNAAKSVVLEHTVTSYGAGKNSADDNSQSTATQKTITQNGDTSESQYSTIMAPDVTQARGEEVYTIFANPDFGTEASILASQKVQIWPMARATITGIDSKKSYLSLPDIHIKLNDLYPSSNTYVRIYQGAQSDTPLNPHIVTSTNLIISDVEPQDRSFSISGLETGITQAGSYTVEILHETPFGTESLFNQVLNKKSNIKVVGIITSSE